MRRIGLVSRVTLLMMAVLLAAIVAAIGFNSWRVSHWHPPVLQRASHIAQTAAIIDNVLRAAPQDRPTVLQAVSGEVMRAAILDKVPPQGRLVAAPHVTEKVRSLMRMPAPGLVAYTDSTKRGLAYPGEDLEGVIRRAVLPLPSGEFLVVGVIVFTPPYSVTILGLPSGFWIGILGLVVAALALLAALRELAPLRRLTESVSRFDGRMMPDAPSKPTAPDPSEIGRLTHAVAEMQARVATLLHERSFLIGAISHDAKTYLTRLRLGAEGVEDAARRAALIRNVDAVAALIDAALDYARGTTSTGQRGAIDLADLVAAEIAEHEAADSGGRAISATLGEAAVVVGDPVALKRVVANLLDNAEKFGRRAIAVEVAATGGRCRFAVSDDGPGVPQAERETVFSPFYRLEKSRSRQTGGSGLGLAIARQIVEAHGGRIAIEGAALGGARVVVDLPARGSA